MATKVAARAPAAGAALPPGGPGKTKAKAGAPAPKKGEPKEKSIFDEPEPPKKKRSALAKKVAAITAIQPHTEQDNLLNNMLEAISPSQASIQKRLDMGVESHAKLLKQKGQLDDKLMLQRKEHTMAVANGEKDQAIACMKQIEHTRASLKSLQPKIMQLADLSSRAEISKLHESTAVGIASLGSVVSHYNGQVDADDLDDTLLDIKEDADDLDGKGAMMDQPVTKLLEDVESMEMDIEEEVDRQLKELAQKREERDDMRLTSELPALDRWPSSASPVTAPPSRPVALGWPGNGSGGNTSELSFGERTYREPPATASSSPIRPTSPEIDIPRSSSKKKKNKKHKESTKKASSSNPKRSRPQELPSSPPLTGIDFSTIVEPNNNNGIYDDDLLDGDLDDDIVFRYSK